MELSGGGHRSKGSIVQMMTSTKVPVDSHHAALEPVMLKDRYEVTYTSDERKGELLSFADSSLLATSGWQRRGMHPSKLTDFWAHPQHSPKPTKAPEEVVSFVENRFGEREKVVSIVDIERTRWRWFTREEAMTIEGHYRRDVVPNF